VTIAHIGGIPVEEGVPALAPAAASMVLMVRLWLRRR
jgi:hypothetical protein